ncbi:MAG TPA: HAMP domain-containing sensor histidine kinase [Candidatus Acidoferrales bacterium]|nr:HAMP domain-containing sensor histidine kinase [Candidatus Acidoferrales bacterium]
MSQSENSSLSPVAVRSFDGICRWVSIVAATYAIVGGTVTLLGWALDVQRMTDWRNDNISMFPNTAVCVVTGGVVLLCLFWLDGSRIRVSLARLLAMGIAVVGLLTLVEHLIDIDFSIDTVLFQRSWGQHAATSPMRMGPPASTSFLVLGLGLLLATYGESARRRANDLALAVLAIASLSLIGYWFGANELFGVALYTGISWQTSTMLAALSIGTMAATPRHGIIAALGRNDAGGTMLRRLIVPIVGIPLLLGWYRVEGQQEGIFDLAFGTAVRTLAEIVLFVSLLWWTAKGISEHARAAEEATRALRESEQRYREIAQAAKDADHRKDVFLATLAHELRNPLAPIGNALAIIKLGEDDRDTLRELSGTIERQFCHMVRLVDDLLDIGRITRDKLELRTERLDLVSIVHQAVETVHPLCDELGHKLSVTVPSEAIWVRGDPVRLAQVFSNLLNNACKFTNPGGTVSIALERRDSEAMVFVKDTGIGIASNKLDSIFEMFEQVDKSLERTRGGMGIGLTLVKRLVELHGGQISARSEGPGRGSELVARLPILAENNKAALDRPTSGENGANGAQILAVDDLPAASVR